MQPNQPSPEFHPIAEQVEGLIRAGKAQEASQLLEAALVAEPTQPDLRAAQGLLHVFAGEEDAAVELIHDCGKGPRARRLGRLLTEHYMCRQQLAAKKGKRDGIAHLALEKVRIHADRPLDHIGIKLSACLIVKDEAKNLARCLNSVKDLVDEIIVVDTGSTDETVAIAESFGAHVDHFEWCNDFSAARNFSLEIATGDWALWIDADEELTPESVAAIERAIVRPQFGGYAIEIVNFTEDDSEAARYVHNPVRLFRREPGIKFAGRIHEQVMPSIAQSGRPWAYLKGAQLLHYGYRPSEMEARNKVERTVTMIQKELADNPTDSFQWFNLANAYTAANDFIGAEHAAAQCAKYLAPGDQVGALNYQLWSNALLKQDRAGDASKVCDAADRNGFGTLLNDFERANAYLRLGLHEEALDAANRCLAAEWPSDMTGDASIVEYKRYIVRGQILSVLGQFPEALSMFERALRVNPTYGPAIYSKAATLEKAGQLEEALDTFCAGQQNQDVAQLCLKGAGRVCAALDLQKRAAEFYREAWRKDVHDEEAWIGWIKAGDATGDARMLVEAYSAYAENHVATADILINWGRALNDSGEFERALICFREAVEREPQNPNAYFNAGDLLYKLEQFVDAAEYYQAGLRIEPNNASGWFVLGNALARLGAVGGARLGYEQALAIRPDYEEARHNLEVICEAA
ncbi:MAG: hypothetical protein BGO01_20215 [Armatimonadetes bacterium 55-13]|nr:tetratricopeptide repeat protein [Armatimonadota bacterium]OJU64438.1 MAG: hypothetical protein BGO01_20215 [Armatimonadetes bacterium 55-13]